MEEVLKVEKEGHAKVLVVLDDDPTGTQTVHGVTVLTEWWVHFTEDLALVFPERI